MNKLTKIVLAVSVLICAAVSVLADGHNGRKIKNKLTLNITAPVNLKNSISFNLTSGLKYTGSLLVKQQSFGSSMLSNAIVTYQKGNTIYIIPYKQKIIMPDSQQGYAGMKLIIRPH